MSSLVTVGFVDRRVFRVFSWAWRSAFSCFSFSYSVSMSVAARERVILVFTISKLISWAL